MISGHWGGELQCGGLQPLCEGLERGGSSVEEWVEQPAGVPSGLYLVAMEWMVTITGDSVGYPRFGGFFSEEKNFDVFHVAETEKMGQNVYKS